tara:strand:- start:2190 stop:2399 length:210 start_codon:yes stop_codon:yes gene_type:complete
MLDLNNNQTKVGLGVVATLAVISTTYLFRDNIKALFSKGSEEVKDDVIVKSEQEDKDSEDKEERVNTDE